MNWSRIIFFYKELILSFFSCYLKSSKSKTSSETYGERSSRYTRAKEEKYVLHKLQFNLRLSLLDSLNLCVVSLNLLKCVCCVFEFVISIDIYSINWKVCKEDENSEQLTFNL